MLITRRNRPFQQDISPNVTQNQSETAIFIHILKTAGTSLHHIMQRQYHPHEIFSTWENNLHPNEAIPLLESLPDEEKRQIRLIRGHLPYGMHRYIPQPATYFTLLRDPIERAISFYYFLRQYPVHYLNAQATDPNIDFSTFMRLKPSIYLDNGQLRFITGLLYSVPYGELTEAHLEEGKKVLRECYKVVGITEAFDESLLLLKKAYRWQNIYYTKHNVTRKRPQRKALSAEELALVEADNRLDQALYLYACELFEAQKVRYGAGFEADLAKFQRRNRVMAPLLELQWRSKQISLRQIVGRILGN